MTDTRTHWEKVYETKRPTEVSWYQARPETSLRLIERHAPGKSASIIDVGGGASCLARDLLAAGYGAVSVLDIAEAALEACKSSMPDARRVNWIRADITSWTPDRAWDLWHDRALFHFLTEHAAQEAYVSALVRATHAGSHVIIATFAPDGPEKCSGLPVVRYDAEALKKRLGDSFELTENFRESHLTPSGTEQKFQYAVFRRA